MKDALEIALQVAILIVLLPFITVFFSFLLLTEMTAVFVDAVLIMILTSIQLMMRRR